MIKIGKRIISKNSKPLIVAEIGTNHFGSIKNIKNASSQDLAKVKGISKLLSEKIYDYFNSQ